MSGADERDAIGELFNGRRREILHRQTQQPVRRAAGEAILAFSLHAQHRTHAQGAQCRPLVRSKLAAHQQIRFDNRGVESKQAPQLG